jgi:hypothetical protein
VRQANWSRQVRYAALRRPLNPALTDRSGTKSINHNGFGGRGWLRLSVGCADVPTRTLQPETQSLLAIQLMNPLVVDHPALPTQQDVDEQIAIAHPRFGQIADAQPQRSLVEPGRAIADRRSFDAKRDAAAPFTHAVGCLNAARVHAAEQASELFRRAILQAVLVEAEVRDELLQLAVFLPRSASDAAARRCPARYRAASKGRMSAPRSAEGPPPPASASPPASTRTQSAPRCTCSSLQLHSSRQGLTKPEHSHPIRWEKREDVTSAGGCGDGSVISFCLAQATNT